MLMLSTRITPCVTQCTAKIMARSTAIGSALVRHAKIPIVAMILRLPAGQKTARDLILSMIPPRLIVGMAICALFAAISINMLAKVLGMIGMTWLATKAGQYAATFEAMPLWVLIGGAMSQFVARALVAWDDLRVWIGGS